MIDEQLGETCDPPGQPEGMPNQCREDCTFCGDGILDDFEECDDGNNENGDGCSSTCETEQMGGEGCTPGFWKQPQHFGHWVGYSPTESYYDDVFGIEASWGNWTLLAVMRQGGGGEIALGRHAVAALLNAASGGVDYAYSTEMVIQIVQDAYATGDFETAKSMLATQNESYCSLDGQSWLPGQERRTLRTGKQRGSALGSSGGIRDLARQ
jgi:cysteine-rich repeat protein